MAAFAPTTRLLLALPLVLMAACGPAPVPDSAPSTLPPGIDPVTGLPVDLTPGLNDQEPDTCKATEEAAFLLGQSESAIASVPFDRPVRVVPLNTIVNQEEYSARRVNFYLDATGTIVRINCG